MSSLHTRVEQGLGQAGLLEPAGQAIIAAVSGGPDSLALLYVLHDLSQWQPFTIRAAHLDHGLRGEEGAADAGFVEKTCHNLGVPFHTERADVAALGRRLGLSLEAAAREARYDFLARVAGETRAAAVSTGHTQDDQAETVLLHLLRGTGLRGLRGMLPLSRWRSRDGGRQAVVVRPLLGMTRQETEGFCRERGLEPRWDTSNAEERFLRNRLRHEVIPLFQQINPKAREALAHLAVSAARDMAYLSEQVDAVWPQVISRRPRGLYIGRQEFLRLHPSLQAHLLHRAYAEIAGEAAELNFSQIEAMLSAAAQGAGREVTLPRGLRCFTTYDGLLLAWDAPAPEWPSIPLTEVAVPGETRVQGWQAEARLTAAEGLAVKGLGDDPYHAYLDADAAGERLWLRTRQPGDRFHPLGLPGAKKLKEFLIDAHIPHHERDGVPLLVGQQGIVWVAGWRIAHWARVTEETRRVLEVRLGREGGGDSETRPLFTS
ncbi:MAG: tRNA lysidine(34) synthetase TilS [Chloroflexi bacterium]|nr:tRNA lysidine(34) synthetase TilS [Chloroflexota bacterium]